MNNQHSSPPPDRPAVSQAPGVEFRWRIHRADAQDETLAQLLFTQEPGAAQGSLQVTATSPAMKSLIMYFLIDPHGHRPLYFRDTGTISGPHIYTFGQIDRSLMVFNRQFPAFHAERVTPFPLP